jgi:alpha-glucosidase
MTVAELASDDPVGTMVAYTDGPDRYHTAYSFVFLGGASGPGHIRRSLEGILNASARAWPAWAFSNHDVVRVVSRWGHGGADPVLAKVLIATLASLRGTVFLYQGEELGLPQGEVPFERLQDPEGRAFWPEYKGRDGCRTPMPWQAEAPHAGFSPVEPWLPVDPGHRPLAVDRQERDPASVLAFTRGFLAWRKQHPALISGDIRFLNVPEPALAFERWNGGERLVCGFNLGSAPVVFSLPAAGRRLSGHGLEGQIEAGVWHLPVGGGGFIGL